MTERTLLSIVVPSHNEEENIEVLFNTLNNVLSGMEVDYEILFINDGSTDGTPDAIKSIAGQHERVRYLSFSRNFGHQAAIRAGIDAAKGDAIVMMDADLQHPPSLIPKMVKKWNEGFDVVNTVRKDKPTKGDFLKRHTSRLFYNTLNRLSDVRLQPGMADFRLIDRRVAQVVRKSNEADLFLRGFISWCGFKQYSIEYIPNRRYAGKTKYSFPKMMALAIDGLTSFSIRPLRFSIYLSLFFAGLSALEAIYILYVAAFTEEAVPGWSSLALLISTLGAATLLMLGIMGEYIGRAFMQGKGRAAYVVAQTNVDDILTEETPKKSMP